MSQNFERIIESNTHDLGGFTVRRVLPAAQQQVVGPFIFFDHLGPANFVPGTGIDVRPHPHIGLATVTYLFEGELLHRDSLGFVQAIRPGDVNWMVAGKGIAHSERTAPEARANGFRIHGIQSWIALPQAAEEIEPGFYHHPVGTLPVIDREGVQMRLIAGTAFGQQSPVAIFSGMFYLDVQMSLGSSLTVPPEYAERSIYVVEGAVKVAEETITTGQMAVLKPSHDITVNPQGKATRFMLLGGDPLDGSRHIWWNFVSSSKVRIEQAKNDWLAGRFGHVPGETEFIPLPEK